MTRLRLEYAPFEGTSLNRDLLARGVLYRAGEVFLECIGEDGEIEYLPPEALTDEGRGELRKRLASNRKYLGKINLAIKDTEAAKEQD
jgi:hypothetical protein